MIPLAAVHGLVGPGGSHSGGPTLGDLIPDPNPGARPTYLNISFTPSRVDITTQPGTVNITATLSLGGAGLAISISFGNSATGPWTLISTGSTDASGNYTVTWSPPATGTYYFKADFEGNMSYLSSTATSAPLYLIAVPEFPVTASGVIILLAIGLINLLSQRSRKRTV